jgi:hypothetical protein
MVTSLDIKEEVDFLATGVSIVMHPFNPWVPIIHMNVRYFELSNGQNWFGGGIDLTPHIIIPEQAKWFHQQLKSACDLFDPTYYTTYQKWADDYFYSPHREETRGIGGIFFDYLKSSTAVEKENTFDFVKKIGEYEKIDVPDMEFKDNVIHFKKNSQAYKKMVIEGFKRVGDEMWPNHIGIFTIPIMFAVKFNIPLVIWGENSQQEYGGPDLESVEKRTLDRKWLEEFGGLLGNRVQDMIGVDGLTEKELSPYFYPSDEDLNRVGVTGIFLGSYFFWDARKQLEIVKANGFSVKEDGPIEGTYTNYENLDENLVGLHDYLKYVKYGFGRTTKNYFFRFFKN